MCGIAVILPGSAVQTPPFAIDAMVAALGHRGPDARRSVRVRGAYLGHTRLSILDHAGGRQPMTDPQGRFSLVFNGEIFNHVELRRELADTGYPFATRSDTEVLLAGLSLHGSAFIERLNGQFAFALWDEQEQMLLAARDRFGEKPLFYAVAPGGQILLASEIKSILASGLIEPKLDRLSIDAYLGLFYVPPDRSIYENIHPLPPASRMTCADGRVRIERYWEPRFSRHLVDETSAVEEIRRLLTAAVARQCVADVPVGAFLSGGLDSSSIVALMSQVSASPARTFSAGFGDWINELPFARQVANLYRTEHHELQMDIDVAGMLAQMDGVYDEPLADSSNIPTYLIARHARRHVKVALSGDGGDELFGGYAWYAPLLENPPGDGGQPRDVWERHLSSSTGVMFDRSALWGARRQPPTAEHLRERYRPPAAAAAQIDRACDWDVRAYLPGDILVKVDRAAMAHGLEVRAPLLDADLADFVLGLPREMRFGGKLKRLLRAACEHLWPPEIRGRGKQGFGAPVSQWLELPDVAAMWRRVMRPASGLRSLLPGVADVEPQLRPQRKWSLLCLGLWLERRTACLANLR